MLKELILSSVSISYFHPQFLDNLAERVLDIRDGRLYDYSGNYLWFIEKRDEMLSGTPEKGAKTDPEYAKEKRRREAEERTRINRERKNFPTRWRP